MLGKRVVVQHLPLGGLLPWDPPQSPQQNLPYPATYRPSDNQEPMRTASARTH